MYVTINTLFTVVSLVQPVHQSFLHMSKVLQFKGGIPMNFSQSLMHFSDYSDNSHWLLYKGGAHDSSPLDFPLVAGWSLILNPTLSLLGVQIQFHFLFFYMIASAILVYHYYTDVFVPKNGDERSRLHSIGSGSCMVGTWILWLHHPINTVPITETVL